MVQNYVASRSGSNTGQDESSRVLKFTLYVAASHPDPSRNWAMKLQDAWNEHGFVEKLNLTAREVQFIWRVLLCSSTIDTKERVEIT